MVSRHRGKWWAVPGLLFAAVAFAQTPASQPTSAEVPIEQQFTTALLSQQTGRMTVAEFNLPTEFVRRVADRRLRSAYEQQFRIIVADGSTSQPSSAPGSAPSSRGESESAASNIRVQPGELPASVVAYWQSVAEMRPPIRAYRAPLMPEARDWPIMPPTPDEVVMLAVADDVERSLAKIGLMLTTAHAIEALGIRPFLAAGTGEMDLLRRVGIPTDLLAYFVPPGVAEQLESDEVVRRIAAMLRDNLAQTRKTKFADWTFRFVPSVDARFALAPDSGERRMSGARMQASRGDDWQAAGDGGSFDVLRNVLQRAAPAELWVHVEDRHAPTLIANLRQLSMARQTVVRIMPSPLRVAQWAQDDARTGFILREDNGVCECVTLAPRFASRGEEASTLVPGENVLLARWRFEGKRFAQSPLLFQGGNLLVVGDVDQPGRILLVGEAEIWRNTSLGLSEAQVSAAMKAEFGVHRVIVLPAVSYHIDYEVSVRGTENGVIALVNDPVAASRGIVDIGIAAMQRGGALSEATATEARTALRSGRDADAVGLVSAAFSRLAVDFGRYPQRVAEWFAAGPADSGVGNVQRFLLALDTLAAATIPAEAMPAGDETAYLRAIQRQMADRKLLAAELEKLGWKVIAIPSLAGGERSINYLNGVQDKTRYLMPAYGGIYAPLDEAAMRAVRMALGRSVQIVPIFCGESQRRDGAVRCSMQPIWE